jgi:hypothetical protein
LTSPGVDLALGVRPNDRLSLFALHGDTTLRYRFPDGLDFGNGVSFNSGARLEHTSHRHGRMRGAGRPTARPGSRPTAAARPRDWCSTMPVSDRRTMRYRER